MAAPLSYLARAARHAQLEFLAFAGRLGAARGPPAVLLFHELGIGDVVLFSGALRHLRGTFPKHRLILAARDYVAPLASACPWLDEIVAIPTEEFSGFGKLKVGTLRKLGRETIDLFIVNAFSRGRVGDGFCRLVSARAKVGLDGGLARVPRWERALRDRAYSRLISSAGEFRFEMEHTIDLLEGLGIAVPAGDAAWKRLPPELWIDESDVRWAGEALQGLPSDGLRVALYPTAGSQKRMWPVERYGAVARAIADEDMSFVLNLGSPSDREVNSRLKTMLLSDGLRVCDIGGASTLRQLVAVLDACDIYLGADTSALHMATALGLGTVCPMAGAEPGRFYPWGDPRLHRAVTHRTDCQGCNWHCLHDVPECIIGVSAENVVRTFTEVQQEFAKRSKRPQGRLCVCEGADV